MSRWRKSSMQPACPVPSSSTALIVGDVCLREVSGDSFGCNSSSEEQQPKNANDLFAWMLKGTFI
ncbi:hypothetical protein OUZ56_021992 [Daphnia magna]|uniref:Uncharacterized protein n=1 Tax=Daphnia magna TaxID=35525 RepID=A0ABR0AV15_9CRUS|nr:hypothetical protein OUZ56_021992 [Daphnia magna]